MLEGGLILVDEAQAVVSEQFSVGNRCFRFSLAVQDQLIPENLKVFLEDPALAADEVVPAILALQVFEDVIVVQSDVIALVTDKRLLILDLHQVL